ncbi:MAG: sulfatase-like hydrolase/transferase [Pirellulaceae bacterium]
MNYGCLAWWTIASCFAPLGLVAIQAAERPNVILVLADDVGAAELGCYGNTLHRTPNLDRMAAEGLKLNTFYSTPLCTTTRLAVMTGQYGHHNGYLGMNREAYKPAPDNPQRDIGNHFTNGDLMKSAGYVTAMAGKWQLSGSHPTLIHDAGFDEYRMWAYQHNLPAGVEHTGRWEGQPGQSNTARFWHPSLVQNGKYLPTRPDDYGPDLLHEFVVDFARRHRSQPFFVYYTSLLTHGPHEETPDPAQPGQRKPRGFQSNLEYLDHLMGRLMQDLTELDLARKTIVILVGDNGTASRGKGSVTELGARVPFIVWGPGHVQPAAGAEQAVGDITDLVPTLAELAGVALPKDRPFDGQSLVPLFTGKTTRHRDWIYSYLNDGRILRDARWLLEIPGAGQTERFFDCGSSRDGSGYRLVTAQSSDEARQARERFAAILAKMPEPRPRFQETDEGRGKKKNRKKQSVP